MKRIVLFFVMALLMNCAKGPAPEDILVRVDDKIITKNEFLKRTELTIRPEPFLKKEIAVNNLILEKMLAIEAAKNNMDIDKPSFDAYLQGIQEQEMREMLFEKLAMEKVSVSEEEVERRFKMSMRDYRIAYYTIHNNEKAASEISQKMNANPEQRVSIFDALGNGEPPVRDVTWKDNDPLPLHEALYANPLKPNSVIGPIKTDMDNYIIMKILAWKDEQFLSPEDARIRIKEVKDRLTLHKAQKKWNDYINGIMSGKRIDFNEDTYNRMIRFYGILYSEKSQEKREVLASRFFQDAENVSKSDSPDDHVINTDAPFFKIDGQVWSVRDFIKAVASHPLVYRNKNIARSQFSEQFKYAIADFLRDQYLNEEAYKKSLDKSERVQSTVRMWKDANVALNYRNQIIKDAIQSGQIDATSQSARKDFWNSYVDSLYAKYNGDIQINHEILDEITLTNMGLAAYRPSRPFPMASPAFPQYTTAPLPEIGERE